PRRGGHRCRGSLGGEKTVQLASAGPDGAPVTVVEQELPLAPLNLPAQIAGATLARAGCRAQVDEGRGIPGARCAERDPRTCVLGERRRAPAQRLVDRVGAGAAEPVLGVRIVAFAPVHDAVPVAALATAQGLTDPVRRVEEAVVQPEPGETRARHLPVAQ